jgi:quinol-cytochrome oxidoreductase complex cytochrome b subunit
VPSFGSGAVPENNTNNQQSFSALIGHLRPAWVPERAIRFTHTFGLGGMALVLFALLLFTGILMMFAYEPSPDRAWQSLRSFQENVLFGRLIRGVHYWSANLLIPVSLLHLLRVFLTGGYRERRRSNWLIGLVMLFFILLSGYTGYLLPWDQTAYWAITICTEMLGLLPGVGPWLQAALIDGTEIGSATVIKFYALHVAVTPMALLALMSWHFWNVRKAGGVVVSRALTDDPRRAFRTVPFQPNLLIKEAVVSAILIAGVLVLAIAFGAPLGEPANPGISPNPAKAPWYFLGFQELLIHFDATFAVLVIPLIIVGTLIYLPYLPFDEEISGDWFLTTRGRRLAIIAAVAALLAVPFWVVIDDRVIGPDGWMPGAAPLISNGLVPFALVFAGVSGFYVLVRKVFAANRNEAVQCSLLRLSFSPPSAPGSAAPA